MKTLITPIIAKEILENNTINRNIIKANLHFLENELREGRFVYNGESIIISKDNKLMDGQHRLLAIINTSISAYVNLVTDIEENTMSTINTGSSRNAASVFSMHNVVSSTSIASSTKRILEKVETERQTNKNGNIKLSNQTIYEFYEKRSELLDAMHRFALNLYQSNVKFITPSSTTSFLYLFSIEDRRAKAYIRELYTGVQEGASDAAIKIRDRLINNKISLVKFSKVRERDILVYGWRKYINNKNIAAIPSKFEISFTKGDINILKSKLFIEDFN